MFEKAAAAVRVCRCQGMHRDGGSGVGKHELLFSYLLSIRSRKAKSNRQKKVMRLRGKP